MILDENEAYILSDLLTDYSDDAPEYDSSMQKLHDLRNSLQDFTKDELLLMLSTIEEYYSDTAEYLTPSYYSGGLPSPSASAVLSQRELLGNLRKRIQKRLSLLQAEP